MSEEKTIQGQYAHGPIDTLKQFWIYVAISLIVTIPGLIVMGMSIAQYPTHSPLRLGIDFTGGTMLQYGFSKTLNQDQDLPKMRSVLEKTGLINPIIQLQKAENGMKGVANSVTTEQISDKPAKQPKAPEPLPKAQSVTELFKEAAKAAAGPQETVIKSIVSIRTQDLSTEKTIELQKVLKDNFGDFTLLQKNRVGPTLAKELFIKAAWGLVLAFGLIVIYLTIRFQLDYALMAIVALLHDTIFMLGAFSILGWFYHIEVDSMFVTAILTVVGFSVHDTIVVFDRIRENAKVLYTKKLPFSDIVNISVNQTLARSINTSLTALLTLLALLFFGGESTHNFVLAMVLGIATGTYSSIFVASSLLSWWRARQGGNQASSTQPRTA
jgi:preprotein translocase subunit SecF